MAGSRFEVQTCNSDKAPMIYLLDVNALVVLGFISHEFHHRLALWVRSQNVANVDGCRNACEILPIISGTPGSC